MNKLDQERFLSKIDFGLFCWEWKAGKNSDGYGCFWLNRKTLRAPRLAYELFKQPIPEGKVIDHICRNRGCVNPVHMEIVTPKINTMRGFGAGAKNARKIRCLNGHLFDYVYLNGERGCRKCWNIHYRNRIKNKNRIAS